MFALAATSGCGAWDWTKKTLDPDPSIDLTRYRMDNSNEQRLALMFTPMDEPLSNLIRLVGAQDSPPSPEWFELLFMHYPWLDGAFMIDAHGNFVFKHPEQGVKPVNVTSLLEYKGDWVGLDVKAHIDYTEFGPEVYIYSPLFKSTEWIGLIAVHFDLRTLFKFCPEPKDILILAPENHVYSGNSTLDGQALATLDWKEILYDGVCGREKAGNATYTWLSRYIGDDLRLVYAVEDAPGTDEEPWYQFW